MKRNAFNGTDFDFYAAYPFELQTANPPCEEAVAFATIEEATEKAHEWADFGYGPVYIVNAHTGEVLYTAEDEFDYMEDEFTFCDPWREWTGDHHYWN